MLNSNLEPKPPFDILESHSKIMLRGAQAIEDDNLDAYIDLHHDELIFHVFAPTALTGDYRGKDALKNLHSEFKRVAGHTDALTVEVHDTFYNEAHGIWLIQYFPDRENKPDHETVYVVCQFHDHKISEAWFVLWPRKLVTSALPPDGH